MATYSNDAPEAGAQPAYGVMVIDGKPATSVRFQRVEKDGGEAFDLSFRIAGQQVMRLKGLDPGDLDQAVGQDNADAIRGRQDGRGTLTGETLANVAGMSPAARSAQQEADAQRQEAAQQAALAAGFSTSMSQLHPAFTEDGRDGQWAVQSRDKQGVFRDLVTTDDAHEAHRLFVQSTDVRVVDTQLRQVAADYVEVRARQGGMEVEPFYEPDYNANSTFGDEVRNLEPNRVRPAARERSDEIDVDEALTAARDKRARDRDQLAQQMDDQRSRVGVLDQYAKEQDRTNDMTEMQGGKPDFGPLTMTEHEKNRRVELTQQLHAQFRVEGSEFRFKDQPAKVAFRDDGHSLKSSSNDDRVARAMATMADAKGWKTISVSGHPDFRREVWLEAMLRGIEVKGYKPQQQDIEDLAALRERQQRNVVERAPDRPERQQKPQERPQEPQQDRGQPTRGGDAAKPADRGSREYEGILVASGPAPYRNDPKEKASFFVTIATAKGDQTIWGKDLQRSIGDSGVKPGEVVKIRFAGDTEVTVDAVKRDAAGKVIRTEPIAALRNTWDVAKPTDSERLAIVKAVGAALVADRVQDPKAREIVMAAIAERADRADRAGALPPVRVYDNEAPARDRSAERARPQVERKAERTR